MKRKFHLKIDQIYDSQYYDRDSNLGQEDLTDRTQTSGFLRGTVSNMKSDNTLQHSARSLKSNLKANQLSYGSPRSESKPAQTFILQQKISDSRKRSLPGVGAPPSRSSSTLRKDQPSQFFGSTTRQSNPGLKLQNCLQTILLSTSLEEVSSKNPFFLPKLKSEIESMFAYISKLEEDEKQNKKLLINHQQINTYMQISNSKKDQVYQEAVKENIMLKQQLRNIQEQLKKKQEQLNNFHTSIEIVPDFHEPIQPIQEKQQESPLKAVKPRLSLLGIPLSEEIIHVDQIKKARKDNRGSKSIIIHGAVENIENKDNILDLESNNVVDSAESIRNNLKANEMLQSNFLSVDYEPIGSFNQQTEKIPNQSNEQEETNNRIRFNFVQHSTDFYFFSQLLDLNIDDSQVLQYYKLHKSITFLREFTATPAKLTSLLKSLTKEKFKMFFESIRHIQQMSETSINVILKLKQIIDVVSRMNSQMIISDAFEVIVNETCKIIGCDRSSVFLADSDRNELWTRVAKGTNTIRVPLNKGIVGHVATKGETLNILDAHKDYRFNREIDKQTNYKTSSVLCVPIFDQSRQHILGVLQAINKNDSHFFSKDDEGLIRILAALSQQILRNSIFNDQNASFQSNLRNLLQVGIELNTCKTITTLIPCAESIFCKTFACSQIKIFLFNDETKKLFRPIGGETIEEFDPSVGLVGEAFTTGFVQNILNGYQHYKFNKIIDINSSLPVLIIPILKQKTDSNSKATRLGVITAINQRGVEGISARIQQNNLSSGPSAGRSSVGSTFEETLNTFGSILSQIILSMTSGTTALYQNSICDPQQ